ncbi:hypothetical protein C5B91_20855 [Haloferax sp. Atlit-10N]|uniref:Uncharacterized protein n=1 Tax=Haloferax denitrificans ATCC 35960 TaxID=662478 RepID=M0JIV2_9EURY|nr:hypothetical protein C438_02297 [Haloferax denitrificans ATCC 35960]RDZ53530.1 hypothetical protein C5B91_20855 [Haloferax sp. Atlit-10N]
MGFTDPFFTGLIFLTGLFICAISGMLALLTFLLSPNDSKANFVVMVSLISFGFGAATMRITFGAVQTWFSEAASILL